MAKIIEKVQEPGRNREDVCETLGTSGEARSAHSVQVVFSSSINKHLGNPKCQ